MEATWVHEVLQLVQRAIPVLTAVGGLLKVFGRQRAFPPTGRKHRAVQDYELIAQFMQVPLENRTRLEVEQAFHAWLRKPMGYQQIMAIVRFANPSVGFRLYGTAAPYVQLARDGRFVYRPKYAIHRRRTARIGILMAVYFVLAVLALSPLWLLQTPGPVAQSWWVISAAALLVCGYFAWLALDYAASLKLSESFLKEQGRRP